MVVFFRKHTCIYYDDDDDDDDKDLLVYFNLYILSRTCLLQDSGKKSSNGHIYNTCVYNQS